MTATNPDTFWVDLPCPECGHRTVFGYYFRDEHGQHQHTHYVCTFWPSGRGGDGRVVQTARCGWHDWAVPDLGPEVEDPHAWYQPDDEDAGRFRLPDELAAEVARFYGRHEVGVGFAQMLASFLAVDSCADVMRRAVTLKVPSCATDSVRLTVLRQYGIEITDTFLFQYQHDAIVHYLADLAVRLIESRLADVAVVEAVPRPDPTRVVDNSGRRIR